MRNLRRLCAAVVLTLAFSLPALAGDMHCGIVPPPPSSPASLSTEGDMETPRADVSTDAGATASAGDSITEAALSLLQSVLSLF